jgi:adenylate cyclase
MKRPFALMRGRRLEADMLLVTIANDRQRRQLQHAGGPLELGRGPQRALPREIIEDRYTSRDQLVVEELSSGNVRVENLGGPVTLPDGTQLASGDARTLMPPLRLAFGHTTIDLGVIPEDDEHASSLQSLSRPLRASTARGCQATERPGRIAHGRNAGPMV